MAPEPSYPCKYAISHLDESLYIQRSKCLQQPFPSDVTFKLARRCVHGFTYKIKTPFCYNSIHTGFTPTHRHKTHAHTSFVSPRILFYTACSMRAYCTSVASCSLCKRHRHDGDKSCSTSENWHLYKQHDLGWGEGGWWCDTGCGRLKCFVFDPQPGDSKAASSI